MTTNKIIERLSEICKDLDSMQKEASASAEKAFDPFDRGYDTGVSDEAKMVYLRLKMLLNDIKRGA